MCKAVVNPVFVHTVTATELRRFELAPVALTSAQQQTLRQEAVRRIARCQEPAVKSLRDALLVHLNVNVSSRSDASQQYCIILLLAHRS